MASRVNECDGDIDLFGDETGASFKELKIKMEQWKCEIDPITAQWL